MDAAQAHHGPCTSHMAPVSAHLETHSEGAETTLSLGRRVPILPANRNLVFSTQALRAGWPTEQCSSATTDSHWDRGGIPLIGDIDCTGDNLCHDASYCQQRERGVKYLRGASVWGAVASVATSVKPPCVPEAPPFCMLCRAWAIRGVALGLACRRLASWWYAMAGVI